ncbi:MAG: radical SAM/SPASM domain-containing protein [Pirellulales bacterium]
MLPRLAFRFLRGISPRLLLKAGYLWTWKGMRAVRAYRRRAARGELFPPFLFLALTDACNLRCHGCWIRRQGQPRELRPEQVDRLIAEGKRQGAHFYTLLGGEPLMYPPLWSIPARHPDCYFQVISNGLFFDQPTAQRIRRLGNVTPLVSLDGRQAENDRRRGEGVYAEAVAGMNRLRRQKILFGVATTVTGRNIDDVMSDDYVAELVDRGAMYLWYYVFRPVGSDPSPELCVDRQAMLRLRRRLLELRRRHPIVIIDTYWNAGGEAVCPAALGLGFHIGPGGDIEPCPPLSFAREHIDDHGGALFETINHSHYLRRFQRFVNERTRGCVILERPGELVEFLRGSEACDTSARDAYAELGAAVSRTSHHLPGEEIPEDYWVYRFLKRQLFFGMGGYG